MTDDVIGPLGTSRYQSFQPWMGVPVAISVGTPAWMPGIEVCNPLRPWGLLKLPTDFEFRLAYEKQLDRRADEIRDRLVTLSRKYPGQRLVLLCWEDLNDPRADECHRTQVAEWLQAKGLEIHELTAADRPEETTPEKPREPAPEPPALF